MLASQRRSWGWKWRRCSVKIRVYLNGSGPERKAVTATVIRENPKTYVVRLPDGNIVKRSKARDLVKGD